MASQPILPHRTGVRINGGRGIIYSALKSLMKEEIKKYKEKNGSSNFCARFVDCIMTLLYSRVHDPKRLPIALVKNKIRFFKTSKREEKLACFFPTKTRILNYPA